MRKLEQVQACDSLIQQHQLLLPEAAELLDREGAYLSESASNMLAEPLYQRALAIREQQLDSDHPDVAISLNGLARFYHKQGKQDQAEPLYQQALHICEQQVGLEHLQTAEILSHFTGFRHAQGKTQEAAVLYQRALTIRENVLGADSPLATETRERLQEVLVALGQVQAPESHE